MLKHKPCLLLCEPREQVDKFAQRDPILQVLEQGGDRHAGAAKHPGPDQAQRVSLHRDATCPTQISTARHVNCREVIL